MKRRDSQSNAAPLNAPQPVSMEALALRRCGAQKPALRRASERFRTLIGQSTPPAKALGAGLIGRLGSGKKMARKYFAQ